MEYLLVCFFIAGSFRFLSDVLPLCSEEYLFLLFRACWGFPLCKRRSVTALDCEEYLLLDYFLYMYRFACGGGIRFVSVDIRPRRLAVGWFS